MGELAHLPRQHQDGLSSSLPAATEQLSQSEGSKPCSPPVWTSTSAISSAGPIWSACGLISPSHALVLALVWVSPYACAARPHTCDAGLPYGRALCQDSACRMARLQETLGMIKLELAKPLLLFCCFSQRWVKNASISVCSCKAVDAAVVAMFVL